MDANTVKQLFKENELWVEECPAVPQTGIPLTYAFIRQNRHLGKVCQKVAFMLYVNDYIYEITLVKEKDVVFKQLKDNLKNDKKWLDKKINEWYNVTNELRNIIVLCERKKIDILNNQNLAVLYKKLVNSLGDSWSYPIMGEGCDPFSTHRLIPQIASELNVSEYQSREIALTLTQSKVKSFLDEEKLSLLKLSLLKTQGSSQFALKLRHHAENYSWIKNNYLETTVLDEKYFLDEIDELCKLPENELKNKIRELDNYEPHVKRVKQQFYAKYNLSEDLKLSISILETMSWWIDQRKIVMLQGFHAIFDILQAVCGRFQYKGYTLPYLKYATDFEIINLLENNKLIDKRLLAERRRFGLHAMDAKKEWTYFSGNDAEQVYKVFMNKFNSAEIKGLTASTGKENNRVFIGEVSVVSNINKDHFKPGSILVTSMTRPEFVPLMRKAKAIVSDEGGITCHAAIVSRELGIPCIIGTRVATKILKTGDKIEMNVKNGVVRKMIPSVMR